MSLLLSKKAICFKQSREKRNNYKKSNKIDIFSDISEMYLVECGLKLYFIIVFMMNIMKNIFSLNKTYLICSTLYQIISQNYDRKEQAIE